MRNSEVTTNVSIYSCHIFSRGWAVRRLARSGVRVKNMPRPLYYRGRCNTSLPVSLPLQPQSGLPENVCHSGHRAGIHFNEPVTVRFEELDKIKVTTYHPRSRSRIPEVRVNLGPGQRDPKHAPSFRPPSRNLF